MTGHEDLVQRFLDGEMTFRDPGGGAAAGSEVARCRAARDEAIRRLSETGHTAESLAARFGCKARSVVRARARMRAANKTAAGTDRVAS